MGENGLMRVLDTLEGVLPTYVRFHLFGVKSSALSKLKDRPRVASVDSMAWSSAARWEAFQTKQPKDFVIKKSKLAKSALAHALFRKALLHLNSGANRTTFAPEFKCKFRDLVAKYFCI